MSNPKVYDCFTFFNELDLLEIRLNELYEVVDFFVIVEANFTHQGKGKPYFFEENQNRFSQFLDKIIHIKVDDRPKKGLLNADENWNLEHFQRNAIERGLAAAQSNDLIIVSDVDEIPNKDKIIFLKNSSYRKAILLMKIYYYFIDLEAKEKFSFKYYILGKILGISKYTRKSINNIWWQGSVVLRKSEFISAQHCRDLLATYQKDVFYVENAGWHFSYLGGIEKIITKLESFAHAELNEKKYKNADFILNTIKNGGVIGLPKVRLYKKSIENHPLFLKNNIERFKHLYSDSLVNLS